MLALLALAALLFNFKVSFWPKVLNAGNGFGIFPNRNQTANVFALAGILATALAFDSFKRGRKIAWFWTASVILIAVDLVLAYSRAGILLFFGGIAMWMFVSYLLSQSRKGGGLVLAGVALLLTGFFIFGGDTFARFQKMEEEVKGYRVRLQTDALHLAATAPLLGQGIGNFAPVFAMARAVSGGQNRAIHPESDWVWVVVEMGWPAAVLFALAFVLWLWRCFPLSRGSDRVLRSAAITCGVAFALHSFADVSAHRPGSAWPALFLAGLALHPGRAIAFRRWAAPAFRLLGIVLVLISAWWLASDFSGRVGEIAPTPATLARIEQRLRQQNIERDYSAAIDSANKALRIAPLSADLYYQRGFARVGQGGTFSFQSAAWDFGTARFLEPHWAMLCFEEGKAWADAGQTALALDAWKEALHRAGEKGPALYSQMLGEARRSVLLHTGLASVARRSPDYFLVFLEHADRLEFELLVAPLLAADPKLESFSSKQKRGLFSAWFRKGDHSALMSLLLGHPEWRQEGWRLLAMLYAERKDFETACKIARESSPRPAMPTVPKGGSLPDLERSFRMRPDDFQLGLQLHNAQLAAGQTKAAIETLKALQAVRGHPAYLDFIEAEDLEESGEWEKAWKAWLQFGGREFQ
jgi:tetratricopeptide (TPR) repeat protein